MKDTDEFENIVRKDLDVRASNETYDRLREIVLNAHDSDRSDASPATSILQRISIVRHPVARLAVAATVVASLGLGLLVFISTGYRSGVVWAQVAPRADASKGFICRKRVIQHQADIEQAVEFSVRDYESPRYGLRLEGIGDNTTDLYVSFADDEQVTVHRDTKRYTRHIGSRHAVDAVEPDAGISPLNMVRQFMSGNYKKLGRRTIAGVEAEGIEVENPPGGMGNFPIDSHVAQLWVSVETGYPVLIESDVVGDHGTVQVKTIVDQFQWDVQFEPSDFRATISPDYQPMEIPEGQRGPATTTSSDGQ